MFGDLRGSDPTRFQGLEWFRQLLDEMLADAGALDIRSVPRGTFPMLNVGRTDEAVRVYVFAPGLGAEDLDIGIQDNVLTVSGKREVAEGASEASGLTRFRQERFRGEFQRSLALPDGLDIERAEAHFRDGVCEVVLPKREELKPRRIEVKAA